jgi:hypothetical protein
MSCFGESTKDAATVSEPKATAAEGQFLGTSQAFLPQLLASMGYSINAVPGAKKGAPTTYSISKAPLTPEEQQKKDFESLLGTQSQTTLTSGGLNLSPEVLAMVQQIYDQQQNTAQQQIQRTATAAAGTRGLNITDTPIGDPYLRATGESASAIRAAQAQAMLQLRESELARAGGNVQYLDALKQQRSFSNPLAFANFAGGLGANLYGSRIGGRRVLEGASSSDTGTVPGIMSLMKGVGAAGAGFMTGGLTGALSGLGAMK